MELDRLADEAGTRITVAYCQEFHRITWEQACKLNPDNPMAVAEALSDLYEALKNTNEVLRFLKKKTPFSDASIGGVQINNVLYSNEQTLAKVDNPSA